MEPCSAAFAHCSRMREEFLRLVHHRASIGVAAAATEGVESQAHFNSLLAVLAAACLAAAWLARRAQALSGARVRQLETDVARHKQSLLCSMAEAAEFANMAMSAFQVKDAAATSPHKQQRQQLDQAAGGGGSPQKV